MLDSMNDLSTTGRAALDWTWPRLGPVDTGEQGLRERKKRLMRQQLSDTATWLFLERGFDAVRVSEIAEACGVSEKTVFNYFPNKEALLLDREDAMAESIRAAIGSEALSPVVGMQNAILADIGELAERFASHPDPAAAITMIRRFSGLVERTPSLRAHQRDMMDRLVAVAAEAMAERVGMDPEDPEPQMAADALMALWRIQYNALHKYADGSRDPAEILAAVSSEVRRAARLADSGLWSFGMHVQGRTGRSHAKAAAQAADQAQAQVRTAVTEAKRAWQALKTTRHPSRGTDS